MTQWLVARRMSQVPPGEIYVVERLDFLSIDVELVQILQHEVVGLLAKRSGTTIRRKFVKITSHPRVECSQQSNCIYIILQTHQNSASEFQPNFSFRILTKLLAQNVDQTWASKSWPNFSFKISTELQLQNLSLDILNNLQRQNLYQTVANTHSMIILIIAKSATQTTSTSFELASSHTRVTSIKSTKRQLVS